MDLGVFIEAQAQFVILYIYANNKSTQRTQLWNHLL
jgi:hypothetical protein